MDAFGVMPTVIVPAVYFLKPDSPKSIELSNTDRNTKIMTPEDENENVTSVEFTDMLIASALRGEDKQLVKLNDLYERGVKVLNISSDRYVPFDKVWSMIDQDDGTARFIIEHLVASGTSDFWASQYPEETLIHDHESIDGQTEDK